MTFRRSILPLLGSLSLFTTFSASAGAHTGGAPIDLRKRGVFVLGNDLRASTAMKVRERCGAKKLAGISE